MSKDNTYYSNQHNVFHKDLSREQLNGLNSGPESYDCDHTIRGSSQRNTGQGVTMRTSLGSGRPNQLMSSRDKARFKFETSHMSTAQKVRYAANWR